MSNIYDKQIETMKRLINYGVNENTNNGKSIVEYQAEGADGKTYGIIRECNKFYIKVAPKKDTALVAEDYDYIGGFNNRKENEYSSYNMASKQFELKMKSLNEAYSDNKKNTYQFKPYTTSEWQINETKEMRDEINRFNDILINVNTILNENNDFTLKHTTPEAPAVNPSKEKVNTPFTNTAVANGDKDFTKTETNYAKAGTPFDQDGTVTDSDMESDKNKHNTTNSEVYTEKPKYVETGVAGMKKTNGKSVKMNENNHVVRLTEEQVLAWSRDNDEYLDKSNHTEIGDGQPYCDDSVCEDSFFHNDDVADDEQLADLPDEIILDEVEIDVEDVAGMEEDEVPFPDVEDDKDEEFELDIMDDDDDDEMYLESKIYSMVKEAITLNDFGKHPAYHKTPMTLPDNIEIELNGCKDWNDDSVKSDKPFGVKIGDSAPYTEKTVEMLTDMIYSKLKKKI